MGDTVEEQEQPRSTEKAYCCSNSLQTEASLFANFDLVLLIISLVASIVAIAAIATDEDPPAPQPGQTGPVPYIYNDTIASDPSHFFYWSITSQVLVFSLILIAIVIRIVFSVLLIVGVARRKHGCLLAWFISTLVFVVTITTVAIVAIAYATGKVLFSGLIITYVLYKWYCLWIVKLLISDIRAVRAGYANPLEDSGEIEQANNLMPPSDSFTVDKF